MIHSLSICLLVMWQHHLVSGASTILHHVPRNTSACHFNATSNSTGFSNLTDCHNHTNAVSSSVLPKPVHLNTEINSIETSKEYTIASTSQPAIVSTTDFVQHTSVPLNNGTFSWAGNSTSKATSPQISGNPAPSWNSSSYVNESLSSWNLTTSQITIPTNETTAPEVSVPTSRNSASPLRGVQRIATGATRYVFAHFMVSNTVGYQPADWQAEMVLAQASSIDAFVLNMARDEDTNGVSLENAFIAAANLGNTFKLFFSFDYAGNGLWKQADVENLILKYRDHDAYFKRGSQPLVSTFEGPLAYDQWPAIKLKTGCYFVPSWSSLGARRAMEKGVVDGLFSWAGWPDGPNDMSTTVDESYRAFLLGKTYMMPVSPWFYTNMPGFRKNWLWRGDDLWYDRWQQVVAMKREYQPEYLQIITWNDWGESHYIGPLRTKQFHAFDKGRSPFNYVADMPHDGWRLFLPYYISFYKNGRAPPIAKIGLVVWYRTTRGSACSTGGTTGNTASQLQTTYPPNALSQDKIFFSALLTKTATISVTVGGVALAAKWEHIPEGLAGIYHGSVDFGTNVGAVVVTVVGTSTLTVSGKAITANCPDGIINWNAWVGSAQSTAASVQPAAPQGCIAGTGPGEFAELCAYNCKYNYCPESCSCTTIGTLLTPPTALTNKGCPVAPLDQRWDGLCDKACNLGNCPSKWCIPRPRGYVCNSPKVGDPIVPVCVSGSREDTIWNDLCSYTCRYGFCPPEICDCLVAGVAALPQPASRGITGRPVSSEPDFGLCAWACDRGFCPPYACISSGSPATGVVTARHVSPPKATIVPFPALVVGPTAVFTMNTAVYNDILILRNWGNQNKPPGPGSGSCQRCDLLRLLTSTCCGIAGAVTNPIVIPANVAIPRDLILKPGFIFFQDYEGADGTVYRPGAILPNEIIIPQGTSFPFGFAIPAGTPLSNTYTPGEEASDDLLYIEPSFWQKPHTISCDLPCSIVLPPYSTISSFVPTPFVSTILTPTPTTTTITPPAQTEQYIRVETMTASYDDDDNDITPLILIPRVMLKPLCMRGICPPAIFPFPPTKIIVPPVTIVPIKTGGPGPIFPGNTPPPIVQESKNQEEEETEDEEDEGLIECPDENPKEEDDYSFFAPNIVGGNGGGFPGWIPSSGAGTGGIGGIGGGAGVGSPKVETLTVVVTEVVTATTVVGGATTQIVIVTAPPPIPAPPPNPKPDRAQPSTDEIICEAGPTKTQQDHWYDTNILGAAENFCRGADNRLINGDYSGEEQYAIQQKPSFFAPDRYKLFTLLLGVKVNGNCEAELTYDNCLAKMKDIINGCYENYTGQRSVAFENQGGKVNNNCEQWWMLRAPVIPDCPYDADLPANCF